MQSAIKKVNVSPEDNMTYASEEASPASLRVNHVMSKDIQSDIFSQFIMYLSSDRRSAHSESIGPQAAHDVYHYHRIHVETEEIRKPSIVTVHHDLEESDPWLHFDRFAPAYRMVDRIVCLNTRQQRFLHEQGYRNTTLIPHGYHRGVFPDAHDRSGRKSGRIRLGLASKRYARRVKGEAFLMEIAKRLDPDHFEFILVGRGRTYEAVQLDALGYTVRVFEHLPYRLFNAFYREIDALLILSGHEGGPACVPEAVATATPMIATPVGMVGDYLVNDRNGLLLSGDPDLDAAEIMDAATRSDRLRHWQGQALDVSSSAWTWERVAEAYGRLYREVAARE